MQVVNLFESYVQNEYRRLLGMASSYELAIAQYSDEPLFDHMYSYLVIHYLMIVKLIFELYSFVYYMHHYV